MRSVKVRINVESLTILNAFRSGGVLSGSTSFSTPAVPEFGFGESPQFSVKTDGAVGLLRSNATLSPPQSGVYSKESMVAPFSS